MGSDWNNLVKEKFRVGRMLNPKYSLKQAMKAAKKVYKKSVKAVKGIKAVKPSRRVSKRVRKSRGKGKKSRGKK